MLVVHEIGLNRGFRKFLGVEGLRSLWPWELLFLFRLHAHETLTFTRHEVQLETLFTTN